MKKLILLLVLPLVLNGATQEIRQDTNTHKIIKPPPSSGAAFDLDFSNVTTNISGGGGGGGTPGGTNFQLQYNNASTFGGIPFVTYNGNLVSQTAGARYELKDPTDITKRVRIDLSLIPTGTLRNVAIAPSADSMTVIPGTIVSNQFVTHIPASGIPQTLQPTYSMLGGTLPLSSTTMADSRLLGRNSGSGSGPIQEITLGTNLSFSGTTLNATGGGGGTPGGSNQQFQFNNSSAFGGSSVLTTDGTTVFTQTGSKLILQDPTNSGRQSYFDQSFMTVGAPKAIRIADGASVTVLPATAPANQFSLGVGATGAQTFALVNFNNLAGTITMAQNKVLIGSELWVDDTNGNDGTAFRADLTKPFKTIALALLSASAGDVVYVGPGTYAQGTTPLVIPAGVTLVGAGADSTFITTAVTKASNRAGVEGGTSGALANVTIQNTASSGIPFGNGTSSAAFTSFNLSGVKLIGVSDGISLAKSGTTGLNAENVSIQTQGQCIENAVGTATFRASDIVADGTATALARAIRVTAGTVVFRDGSIFAGNSTTTNVAVSATGATSTAEIHNAAITRNATGTTNLDFEQASSATVGIDSVTRTDGTAIATSGTITELSRYQLSDPQLTSLAGLSYTGNTLKVVRVNAAETGFELAVPGGGGIGDVVGPSSSVDSEVALFSGTTGKLLKRATATGIPKLASGVQGVATAGTDYLTPTGTETISNHRINPRVTTAASSGTWSPSADTDDVFQLTAQAAAVTAINNPSGTPVNNQSLIIRFKDDGTPRALTWSGSQWEAGPNQTLPTTTVASQTDWCAFRWNSTTSKWTLLASSQASAASPVSLTATSPIVVTPTPLTGTGVVSLDTTANLSMTALQSIKIDDATTNSTTRILNLNHNTTGTPANGLGTSLGFKGEDSTTQDVDMMVISSQWSDVVDATRTAYLDLRLAASGTPASKFRVWGSGGANLGEGTSPTDPGSGYLDVLTGIKINGVDLKDATLTWTNKRNTPRVTSIASNATWAPSADTDDIYEITAQAAPVTVISNPSGTPVDGQSLMIRFKDNATPRALTWSGSQWEAGPGMTLPTTTVASQTDYCGFKWNAATSKWTMLANSQATAGSGTVTSFSAGDLSPIFTTTEATVTTTPALSFALTNAGAHAFLGNNTGSSAAPAYVQPNFTDLTGTISTTQGAPIVSDTAFASSWNTVTTIAPSKNAVYDELHLIDTADDGTIVNAGTGFRIGGAATTGKILRGNGTNYVASVPSFPNAVATSGKIMQSDGTTGYIASTATWPTSGTAQQGVISDGTNFINDYVNGVASISSASSGINSTETVVVQTPALAANRLVAGTVIQIILVGTCTTTVANASTFNVRWGTAGTTSDGLLLSYTTPAAGTAGTNVAFRTVIEITIRTTGASATSYGSVQLITTTTGILGASSVAMSAPTMTNINTTTASSILSACYKTAASTTTSTFQEAFIEFIYK